MKKLGYLFVAFAFATTMLTSCGKTSKGKMDGEWTMSSAEETQSDLTQNTTNTTKITDAVVTYTSTNGSSTTTSTGVVNQATWTIKKDGTWTRTLITTYSQGTYSQKSTQTNSGSWDFLKSVSKDYKNNERVVFNVLSSTSTNATTNGGVTTTATYNDTYLDGENSFIYVVTESKKDALTLSLDGANTSTTTTGGGTTTTKQTTKSTVSLKQ